LAGGSSTSREAVDAKRTPLRADDDAGTSDVSPSPAGSADRIVPSPGSSPENASPDELPPSAGHQHLLLALLLPAGLFNGVATTSGEAPRTMADDGTVAVARRQDRRRSTSHESDGKALRIPRSACDLDHLPRRRLPPPPTGSGSYAVRTPPRAGPAPGGVRSGLRARPVFRLGNRVSAHLLIVLGPALATGGSAVDGVAIGPVEDHVVIARAAVAVEDVARGCPRSQARYPASSSTNRSSTPQSCRLKRSTAQG